MGKTWGAKTVWRLEDRFGRGAFRSTFSPLKRHYDPPGPEGDPGLCKIWRHLKNRRQWYFGFTSLAQYKRWFSHDRVWYTRQGLRLVRYRVHASDYQASDYQVIFVRSRATKVDDRYPHDV